MNFRDGFLCCSFVAYINTSIHSTRRALFYLFPSKQKRTRQTFSGVHGNGLRGSMTESGHDADDDTMEHDNLLGMGDDVDTDGSDNDQMEDFDEGVKRRL